MVTGGRSLSSCVAVRERPAWPSYLTSSLLAVWLNTALSSVKSLSSGAVTVTVCGVLQLVEVKVRLAGDAVSLASPDCGATATVTSATGATSRSTV